MLKVAAGHEVPPVTYKVHTPAGAEQYIESKSVPIILEDGEEGLQQVAQDITERVLYERELKKSLQEKEVLLQEIHHRVKNNLAVVSGLLKIQRLNTGDARLNKILTNCEMRIQSMALIHEKLYQSDSLSKVDFKQYVEDLLSTINKSIGVKADVTLTLTSDPIHLNVNQAVPCGLIISELVSNALEHAFKDREDGEILVKLKVKNRQIYITIKDNGIGIPGYILEKNEQSMGFTIIRTLITQLRATLDIQNDHGTTVCFSFGKQQLKGSSSGIM